MSAEEETERVSLRALTGVFFRIGLFSFGGGTSSWIHRETVVLRSWLSTEEFMAGVAVGQILPGANVSNLAVFIGGRLRGAWGSTLALGGLLAAPFVVILLLAQASSMLSAHPTFEAGMDGIAAAAVGLVLNVGVVSARRFVPALAPTAVMIATFAAISVLHWSLFLTVALIAPVSVALAWIRPATRA
jgi:chromate transporter